MKWDIAERDRDHLVIRRTGAGRLLDAVRAFFAGGALAAAGSALFFAIDRFGRESAGVEVSQGYLLAVAAMGVGAGVVAVVWRMMRQRRWVFDRGAGVMALVWERSGTDRGVEVPLSELRSVRLDRAGVGRKSAVVAVFADGEEPLATSRLGAGHLEPIHGALSAFLGSAA